ncbi:MAG: hypothetical protein KZQ93_20225 [Candidatus Thiodiazotropha sp. (ex Monitilora ramsayi)]|nr:hypothetical protein [Candidatus Thiodiazotropha sp. (ex Monitilora ramsayi)]
MFQQKLFIKTFFLSLVLLNLSACVSTMTRPSTNASKPSSIYAESFVPSEWDLPIGANVVSDSNLVVRKSPTSGNGILLGAVLFGPLGVAAMNSSMSADTEGATKGMASFSVLDLPNMATDVINKSQQNGQMPASLTFSSNPVSGDAYKLQPFMYLETDGVKRSDLMLVLRITQGDGKWTGQYVSHIFGMAEVQQIRYSNEFKEAIRNSLKQSLEVFYKDIQGQLKKSENKIVPSIAKSMFYSKGPLWGWELSSPDEDLFLFHARANPGNVFGGVHIFNAADVSTKPF